MGKYFGTDGVRGVAGADLTCEMAMLIGRGAAAVLTSSTGHKPRIDRTSTRLNSSHRV